MCKPGYKPATAGSPPSTTCMTGDVKGLSPYMDAWSTPHGACVPETSESEKLVWRMRLLAECAAMCLLCTYYVWYATIGLSCIPSVEAAVLLCTTTLTAAGWGVGWVAGVPAWLYAAAAASAYVHACAALCPLLFSQLVDVAYTNWCSYALCFTVQPLFVRVCCIWAAASPMLVRTLKYVQVAAVPVVAASAQLVMKHMQRLATQPAIGRAIASMHGLHGRVLGALWPFVHTAGDLMISGQWVRSWVTHSNASAASSSADDHCSDELDQHGGTGVVYVSLLQQGMSKTTGKDPLLAYVTMALEAVPCHVCGTQL